MERASRGQGQGGDRQKKVGAAARAGFEWLLGTVAGGGRAGWRTRQARGHSQLVRWPAHHITEYVSGLGLLVKFFSPSWMFEIPRLGYCD